MNLPRSLAAWGSADFAGVFKAELADQAQELPLQQGLQHSSYALPERLSVALIKKEEQADSLILHVGLHYAGIIAGCSCADDPTPVDEVTEYCEAKIEITRANGLARVSLL